MIKQILTILLAAISFSTFSQAPPNDNFSNAILIDCDMGSVNGTTINATTLSSPADCGTEVTAPGVWYEIKGVGADITMDLCGAPYDSKINVYRSDGGVLICVTGEDDDNAECGSDDPHVIFPTLLDTSYFVFIQGFDGQTGTFSLNVECACSGLVMNTNDDGYGSLRDVIACASTGETIQFAPSLDGFGIRLTSGEILINNKQLFIQGNGTLNTIIDGQDDIDQDSRRFRIGSLGEVEFEGMTFVNAGDTARLAFGGAIFSSGAVAFDECLFLSNEARLGGAIRIQEGSLRVNRTTFSQNSSDFLGGAINTRGTDHYITNSLFVFNSSGSSGGAIHNENANLHIMNCTFANNSASTSGGAIFNSGTLDTLANTILHNNAANSQNDINSGTLNFGQYNFIGDFSGSGMSAGSNGNITGDPEFITSVNYNLLGNSPCIDAGFEFSESQPLDIDGNARTFGCAVDMGAYESSTTSPRTRMVTNANDSGPGSLRFLIECANPGDTILFSSTLNGDSIKLSSGEIEIDKDLTIIGNGMDETIIDGSQDDDNRLMSISDADQFTVKNMTFQNGGSNNYSEAGGAIDCEIGENVNLIACKFSNNKTGSGIGGGAIDANGEVRTIHCIFEGNEASSNNGKGGAVATSFTGSYYATNCLFTNNNAGSFGAVVVNTGGIVEITNCTVANNSSPSNNSVFFHQSSATTTLNNNIIFGNGSLKALTTLNSPTLIANHNLVELPGDIPIDMNGNFIGDPMFVNAANGNYQLQNGSPAIDEGNNALLPLDEDDIDQDGDVAEQIDIDLADNIRIFGCNLDIGAYENQNAQSGPRTLTVLNTDDEGTGSLRDIIDCAESGDIIRFSSSINGQLIKFESGQIIINKALTFLGNGMDETIIDGSLDAASRFFTITSTVTFRNLTLQNGGGTIYSGFGGAIFCQNGTVNLVQCKLKNNISIVGGGSIYMIGDNEVKAINCIFEDNMALGSTSDGGAVQFAEGNFEAINCAFVNNVAERFGAAVVNNGSTMNITNCTASGNSSLSMNSVFNHGFGAISTFNNNIIYGNGNLQALTTNISATLIAKNNLTEIPGDIPNGPNGNFVGNPMFVDAANGNYQLQTSSPAIDVGNFSLLPVDELDVDQDDNSTELIDIDQAANMRVFGCFLDLGAYENQLTQYSSRTLIVTNTNDSGAGSLRGTIDCANSGDTIIFSQQLDGDSIKLTSGQIVINKDLTILGNGMAQTIIDGSLNANSGLFITSSSAEVKMTFMTFQDGGGDSYIGQGGAFNCIIGTSINLAYCKIKNNRNDIGTGGGAIYVQGNCQTINCVFDENETFDVNGDGGAVFIDIGGQYAAMNCLYMNNNSARFGAAIANFNGTVTITNCTASGNDSDISNSVFFHDGAAISTLNNNVIHGNGTLKALTTIGSPTLIANHNLVELAGDIPIGVNENFVGDPMFVDAANENYQLQNGSPAIDAGNNLFLPIDILDVDQDGDTSEQIDFDLTGDQRNIGCNVDLGAFENQNIQTTRVVRNTADSGIGSLRGLIACANPGDTIIFSSALNGDSIKLNSGEILINKDLAILGNGMDQTIIDGSLDNGSRLISTNNAAEVLIKNLTLQSGGSAILAGAGGGGLFCSQSSMVNLANCKLKNNKSFGGFGGGAILVEGNCETINCVFEENESTFSDGDGGAVFVDPGGIYSATNCLFINNSAGRFGAAVANFSGTMKISNCTAANNTSTSMNSVFYHAESDFATASSTFNNNVIFGNGSLKALTTTGSPSLFANHNLVELPGDIPIDTLGNFMGDPMFLDAANGNYQLQNGSPAIDAGNNTLLPVDETDVDGDDNTTEQIDIDLNDNSRIFGCNLDLGAFENQNIQTTPRRLTVTNTADFGIGSLRGLIACANPGDTIIFSSALNGDPIKLSSGEILINKDLAILGNGMDQTIIDGSLDNESRLINTISAAEVLIKNLTLQSGGSAILAGSGGGGLLCSESSMINLANCRLKNNKSFGGSGGGAILVEGNCQTINCVFEENESTFSGGDGGAVFVDPGGIYSATNCLFINNSAGRFGAAVANFDGIMEISNCTATNNSSTSQNSVFFHQNTATSTLNNNVIFGNGSLKALTTTGSPSLIANHNLVELPGDIPIDTLGNFIGDPVFVDASNGNYQLQNGSPAIDAGNNTLLAIDSLDIDGDGNMLEQIDIDLNDVTRIFGCQLDLGAYENQNTQTTPRRLTVTNTDDSGIGSLRGLIDCANSGDSILFSNLIDGDSIRLNSQISLNKSIVFLGNGASQTIIDGSQYNDGKLIELSSVDTAIFKGITFQNGGGLSFTGFGGAITTNLSYTKFEECTFSNNEAGIGGALDIFDAQADISECTFINNTAQSNDGGGGLSVDGASTEVTVTNTVFESNMASGIANAIFVTQNATLIINGGVIEN